VSLRDFLQTDGGASVLESGYVFQRLNQFAAVLSSVFDLQQVERAAKSFVDRISPKLTIFASERGVNSPSRKTPSQMSASSFMFICRKSISKFGCGAFTEKPIWICKFTLQKSTRRALKF
jgi:hypothetical protein